MRLIALVGKSGTGKSFKAIDVCKDKGDAAVDSFADDVIRVPAAPTLMWPLLTVMPLQIFAAALADAKGLDIDQPRNLAKSVTVE